MKKKLKATLSMFLCAVMVLCSVAVGGMFASADDTVTYEFDSSTGTLTISGTGEVRQSGVSAKVTDSSTLKSVVINYGITSIGSSAFKDCENLEAVTIGNSVTSIGYSAFYDCTSLESIMIPTGVTNIGKYAFKNCKALEELVIPDKVETIGFGTFYGCENLKKVTIGSGVTSIKSSAFENCKSLEEIVIPDKVETMGSYTFYGCENLKKVTIGSGVTSIGGQAFFDCKALEEITVDASNKNYSCEDGVLFNKDKTRLIKYPQAKADKSYSIPQTVAEIQEYAFDNCKLLEKITVGNVIESIGEGTFYDCKALEEIVISKSLTTVNWNAFNGCENLKYVFYTGSQENWNKISIYDSNEKLTSAVIHYNATGHTLAEGKCTVTGCDYACDHTGNTNKATCTEPCLCSKCTKELSPATGHTFGEWKVTKSATFFKDGVETRTCVNEGCTETETRVVLSKFSEFKSGLFGTDFLKAILTVFADLLTSVC